MNFLRRYVGFQRIRKAAVLLLAVLSMPVMASPVESANAIGELQVTQQAGNTVVKLALKKPLDTVPASFSVTNPARVVFDFPGVANGLGRTMQQVKEGDLRSINIVEVADRTRLVLNLNRMVTADTRIDGNFLFITLAPLAADSANTPVVQHFAETKPGGGGGSVRNIGFRRGKAGEGLITVDLSDPNLGIDVKQQGQNLVVEFLKVTLPDHLRRRLDVTDFATPVSTVTALPQGDNVRVVIAPKGLWEHTAYQSDNQFVVEVKPLHEDPAKIFQGSQRQGYQGEKVSLNFQNIPVRELLHVFADITNFNIVISDTVAGNVSLRLNDVPWDQALDIVLQQKGLAMRKNGNVIWIAPADELAAKEKLDLESKQQISDLEPLRTESFQLNYHKARAVSDFVRKEKDQTVLSKRGSIIVDERSNKLFVTDTPSRIDDLRRLIAEIDVPKRQVLIEARIVEADNTFSKSLGVRLGYRDKQTGHKVFGDGSPRWGISGGGNWGAGYFALSPAATAVTSDSYMVDMPVSNPAGQFALTLFNAAKTQLLSLELSAAEADGKGKTVSSPRVLTADQVEAVIEDGKEVPYWAASSSGATSVGYRKAVLSLKVKPQITPDGRVIMTLDVNKDNVDPTLSTSYGIAINTKHVKTEVLVENGGTVVIGGVYIQEERNTVSRVPVLGDLPYVGFMFRNTEVTDNRRELLIFLTPKIVSETLTLR